MKNTLRFLAAAWLFATAAAFAAEAPATPATPQNPPPSPGPETKVI